MAERLASSFHMDANGLVDFDTFLQTADYKAALERIFGAIRSSMGNDRVTEVYKKWLTQ